MAKKDAYFDVVGAREKLANLKKERVYRNIDFTTPEVKKSAMEKISKLKKQQSLGEQERALERKIKKSSTGYKIRERVGAAINKALKSKVTSRAVLKKQPRATYHIPSDPDYQRSSFFNQEYEREKNIISWK